MEPKKINHFWAFRDLPKNEGDKTPLRELSLEGAIAQESWFDDEVTPAAFKAELRAGKGDIVVRINSPGGDCVAAAQIYDMLRDYATDSGTVTVYVDGIAASAASVIAMAGDVVEMSPLALMMIHNPWTVAAGDREEMRAAMQLLDEVKESIINAYETKTKLSRNRLDNLMTAETWMSSGKAVELGFADRVRKWGEDEPEGAGQIGADGKAAAMAWEMRPLEGSAIQKAVAKVRAGNAGTPAAYNPHTNPLTIPNTHTHTLPQGGAATPHRQYSVTVKGLPAAAIDEADENARQLQAAKLRAIQLAMNN